MRRHGRAAGSILLLALLHPPTVVLGATLPSPASVNLSWNANPESDIASYQVSYGTAAGSHPTLIQAGANTAATVTGLVEGTTYYFVVNATNQAGQQSAPSAEVSYQPPVTTVGAGSVIPHSGWSLRYVDSAETNSYPAANAFDGNSSTFWHSNFTSPTATLLPHEIQIDMGVAHPVQGFHYLPRQDNYTSGTVLQYEFYTSVDGVTWGAPAASGVFANSKAEKESLCTSRNARYVRFKVLTAVDSVCAVAELNVLQGTDVVPPVNQAPVAAAQSLTTAAGSPLAMVLSASDADDDALTYALVSQPAHGTLSGTAPNVTYTPAANYTGSDSFTFKANDGTHDSAVATVSLTVTPVTVVPGTVISRTGWALSYVDSAETNGYPAGNAFDGDPNTFWHSNFTSPTATLLPHEIQLDLGTLRPLNGFRYLPRQDNYMSGNVLQYEFYTSTDGATWGAPAVSGIFDNTKTEKEALFSSRNARFFRFRVITAVDGVCAAAELNVLQGQIVVAPVNHAPVFTLNPIPATDARESVAYTGLSLAGQAADADAGDAIRYSKVSGPAWLMVAADGTLSGTPPSGSAGLNTFVVRATDGSAATGDAQLQINVVGTLPLPWATAEIGSGQLAGSTAYAAGTFTQAGAGLFGGRNDSFRFTYQTLSGDGEIIAQVPALQNTGTASRVGVMIRDSLAANAMQAFMGMSGGNTYRRVVRTSTGGSNSTGNSSTGILPNTWVRLVRTGNLITAYKSANGTTWTSVSKTTITMAANCYIGLAVTSGSNTVLNTSQFSNVSVTP